MTTHRIEIREKIPLNKLVNGGTNTVLDMIEEFKGHVRREAVLFNALGWQTKGKIGFYTIENQIENSIDVILWQEMEKE